MKKPLSPIHNEQWWMFYRGNEKYLIVTDETVTFLSLSKEGMDTVKEKIRKILFEREEDMSKEKE